ncbi:MAG: Dna2/Cas4 domain-containing protein [Chloroflexi bacterium]|nr:Dna2/Cas4 domain-containing protein [Chloroflexota bacterium]
MSGNGLPLVLALLMAGTAVFLALRSRNLRRQSGLPDGNVIYSDTGTWFPNAEPLYAPNFALSGKPDYLVEQHDGSVVPVELKSGRAPSEPWEGHVLQLAAYCLLVDETFGRRPSFGILQYQDKAFAIDYTLDLEEDLLDLLAEMRDSQFDGELDRDHNDWHRCVGCSMRNVCHQRMA